MQKTSKITPPQRGGVFFPHEENKPFTYTRPSTPHSQHRSVIGSTDAVLRNVNKKRKPHYSNINKKILKVGKQMDWIMAKDRLPEKNGYYKIATKYCDNVAIYNETNNTFIWFEDNSPLDIDDVIAWKNISKEYTDDEIY